MAFERPSVSSSGMRIAQLVVAPVVRVTWDEVADLPETGRGKGGFVIHAAGALYDYVSNGLGQKVGAAAGWPARLRR